MVVVVVIVISTAPPQQHQSKVPVVACDAPVVVQCYSANFATHVSSNLFAIAHLCCNCNCSTTITVIKRTSLNEMMCATTSLSVCSGFPITKSKHHHVWDHVHAFGIAYSQQVWQWRGCL
uniref:Uncharacterized protein n=1 Tax=Lygus hesperus TaxID=30085 RepID=A0A146M684_LYGHE